MEFDDTYKTIELPCQGVYKEKGSKFIALAYPVENLQQIKALLSESKKQYFDARHHCYAWALEQNREQFRVNDDGEPSGTAGKPIYGQILANDLTNILIIVVRYFGGIKLGVRGLINAYKGAAQDALYNASIVTRIVYDYYRISFSYEMMNDVMKILKDHELQQTDHDFGLSCRLSFLVRKNKSEEIKHLFENLPGISINFREDENNPNPAQET
jgi:uncharacterized YigZ family protein